MKQHKQIGKYTKKEDILNGKAGREFVTPNNKVYVFNWRKEGRKYIFIIEYLNGKMQVPESDFNRLDIDYLLSLMEKELLPNN